MCYLDKRYILETHMKKIAIYSLVWLMLVTVVSNGATFIFDERILSLFAFKMVSISMWSMPILLLLYWFGNKIIPSTSSWVSTKWALAVVVSVFLLYSPLLLTICLCSVNGLLGYDTAGCGDIVLLFAGAYVVILPIALVSSIGFLVSEMLRSRNF